MNDWNWDIVTLDLKWMWVRGIKWTFPPFQQLSSNLAFIWISATNLYILVCAFCTGEISQSVRLRAHTCMPVRKSNYWPKHGLRHLRLTSLRHQQQQTVSRHSRKMAYEERDKATSLYISYMAYMIITQTRCIMALFLAVISEERRCRRRPSAPGSRPRERNLVPALNAKSDPIWWNVACRSNATINRIIQVFEFDYEKSDPVRF